MKKIQSTVSELHIAPQPGADATSYWLVPSVTQVKSYDEGFSFTPEYVSCDSYSKVGAHAPVKGIGPIKYRINKINGNSTEEAFYTNPIEVLYQYASIDFILYVAGQVVDRKSVSIVNDGEGGTDAVVYWLSPSCTQVKRRADGVAIPESVSCTRYRRIGSNNADTTEIGSIRYVVTYLDGRVNYECDYVNPIVIDSNFASVNLRYYINGRLVNEVTVPVIDDGEGGPMGQRGMLPYPMGNFDINTTYTATKNIAPFVYYVDGKTYYVMNKEGVSVGINPVTDYANNGQNATWIPFENYKAIYVEMLMARFGLIGKAVFYDEYMFSQHGTDVDGNPSTDYKGFEDGTFKPKLLLDFLKGNCVFDGSGIFRGSLSSPYRTSTGMISKLTMGEGMNIKITDPTAFVFLLDIDEELDGTECEIVLLRTGDKKLSISGSANQDGVTAGLTNVGSVILVGYNSRVRLKAYVKPGNKYCSWNIQNPTEFMRISGGAVYNYSM